MRQLLPLLLGLFLSGCYSDQKQQLSACEFDEHARSPQTAQDLDIPNFVALCMRAHGYEIVPKDCPVGFQPTNMGPMQAIEPSCYEPMSWFGKQGLRFEKWFGTSN